uniref:Uncharacterized protein n=1 Tax=Micrurus lemniscatus lemniscatus TaxID=129467 RepID=A0A2D4JIN6_MICLE
MQNSEYLFSGLRQTHLSKNSCNALKASLDHLYISDHVNNTSLSCNDNRNVDCTYLQTRWEILQSSLSSILRDATSLGLCGQAFNFQQSISQSTPSNAFHSLNK